MEFDIYCDESRPDLLSSQKPSVEYMIIGSLWLKSVDRDRFKQAVHELRDKHHIGGEFKWHKVSPSKSLFYTELLEWFMGQGGELRFRCIGVKHSQVDLVQYHDNDQELGFYKFYYQMLHHWITDFNEYKVFCDFKSNRRRDRLHVLKECLAASNLSSDVANVQAVRSRESVLIQLTDLLTGAVSARLNNTLSAGTAKCSLVTRLESLLRRRIAHTTKAEAKFNVFIIDLSGGW